MRNQILSIFVMLVGVLMYSSCTSELSSSDNVKDDVSLETRSMVGCDSENVPPVIFIEAVVESEEGGDCCVILTFDSKFDGNFFRVRFPNSDPNDPFTILEVSEKGVIKNGMGYVSGSPSNERRFCFPSNVPFSVEIFGPDHPYVIACNSFDGVSC